MVLEGTLYTNGEKRRIHQFTCLQTRTYKGDLSARYTGPTGAQMLWEE